VINSSIGLAKPFVLFFQIYWPTNCPINPVSEALVEMTVPLFHHENQVKKLEKINALKISGT
jgi:hypothetical protein